jgi:hypothetical protein
MFILSGLSLLSIGISVVSMLLSADAVAALPGFLAALVIAIWVCFAICWVFWGILSVFTLLGAIFSLKRKKWALALVGSICGIFISGFAANALPNLLCLNWFVGVLFFAGAVTALVLVILGKKEFS